MVENLVRIVVEAVAFFVLSDDSLIDPDTATQQLEQIFSMLQSMDSASKAEVIRIVESMRVADPKRYDFYNQFIENLLADA